MDTTVRPSDSRPIARGTLLQALLVTLLMGCFSGCQSLAKFPSINKTDASGVTMDNVLVQVRPASRKARNVEVPMKPDMRLQDVVDASKAKFRNKLAYIVRQSPVTGENHKLEARFGSNRRISLETDYAIQPGDRVVVAEDTTSSFDRVMQAMLGRS